MQLLSNQFIDTTGQKISRWMVVGNDDGSSAMLKRHSQHQSDINGRIGQPALA